MNAVREWHQLNACCAVQQATYIDTELKTKMSAYNTVKNNLNNYQRQQTSVFSRVILRALAH